MGNFRILEVDENGSSHFYPQVKNSDQIPKDKIYGDYHLVSDEFCYCKNFTDKINLCNYGVPNIWNNPAYYIIDAGLDVLFYMTFDAAKQVIDDFHNLIPTDKIKIHEIG